MSQGFGKKYSRSNKKEASDYLELIEKLLNQPDKSESTLKKNKVLVDQNLTRIMRLVAIDLRTHEQEDSANFLENLAARVDITKQKKLVELISDEYNYFILKLTWEATQSGEDFQKVHPLLVDNLEKIDESFPRLLYYWAISRLKQAEVSKAKILAAAFGVLSVTFKSFSLGNKAINLETGISCCEIASIVFTRESYPETWAENQCNLASIFLDRIYGDKAENIEKALHYCDSAFSIRKYESLPERWATTKITQGIAFFSRIRGDRAENLENSIEAYQQSLQVYTYPKFSEQWSTIQHNLGLSLIYRIYGDKVQNQEQAILAFKNALKVRSFTNMPERWADTQDSLGIAYWERILGDNSKNIELAIEAHSQALKVYIYPNFPYRWADLKNHLGIAYYNRSLGNRSENLQTAISYFKDALEVNRRSIFPQRWAIILHNISGAYFEIGQVDEALNCLNLCLEVRTPFTDPIECLKSGRGLGDIATISGHLSTAIKGYSTAINALEVSYTETHLDSRRQEILGQSIDVYEKVVNVYIKTGCIEKALEYVERSRSKHLVDLIASNDLYQTNEISPEVKPLLEQFEALQQQIDQERSQHSASSPVGRSPSFNSRATFEAYSEAIAQLESEKQTIWQAIRKHDPVLAGQIQVEALTFEQIQNLIDQPTTAILSIFTTSTDTYIFVVRQNQLTLHICPEQSTETLQNWIVENWSKPYVEDTDQWKTQLSSVLATLAQRLQIRELIEQHLQGVEELIVVPHLFLHQIPFAALPIDEGEYLGDRFLIRHIPSCQILQFCRNRPDISDPWVYGLVENATDDLPCAGFEGAQLSELFGISHEQRLRGGKQATVENFRNLAKSVNVLHCSHHAGSRLDDPLHSELLLANGSITLGQLLTPGWRLPHLSDVFLSCCETHLGAPTVTDDILTLATGFLCAGARSVISTLWLVDDLATALFSIFYYEQRYQGCDRLLSLQNAQKRLRCLNREHLNEFFNQAERRRQQIRQNRDLHLVDSATYQALNGEYESYANVARQLYQLKNSSEEFPFFHPFYWAGFICQGLR